MESTRREHDETAPHRVRWYPRAFDVFAMLGIATSRKLRGMLISAFLSVCCFTLGCNPNATASLGGDNAGDRGNVRVVFINNTSEQAVFTVGTYDRFDQAAQPDFVQFGVDANERPLMGDESSAILSLDCARVLGVGSPMLLDLIRDNLADEELVDAALISGVNFRRAAVGDDNANVNANANDNSNGNVNDNANGNSPADNANENADEGKPEGDVPAGQDQPELVGSAPPFEALLGVDFPCNSLVIIRLEPNDLGRNAYRIDFQVIPSDSTR